MPPRDYYGEALLIAQALENAGFLAEANRIRCPMEEGSTGTEIFMMLKIQLEIIMASNSLPEDVRVRVIALHRRLVLSLS